MCQEQSLGKNYSVRITGPSASQATSQVLTDLVFIGPLHIKRLIPKEGMLHLRHPCYFLILRFLVVTIVP